MVVQIIRTIGLKSSEIFNYRQTCLKRAPV